MIHYSALVIVGLSASAVPDWPAYEDVDTNHDGQIDAMEAELVAGLDFILADKNQDGVLSREEYAMATDTRRLPL